MGARIKIMGARVSYPHLVTPRAIQAGDTPKYGVALLVPKGNPAIAEILAAEQAERGAKWGANQPPTLKPVPMYDGDTDPKYNTETANHGHMILSCNSVDAVPVIGVDGVTIQDPAVLYAGSYANAFVDVYAYPKDGQGLSKGCAFGLTALQFVMDGERLDGRPDATTLFDAVTGAPPPVAPGIQPGVPGAQSVPQQPVYAPPVAGVPPAPAPVAAQPVGAPPAPMPGFLG